MTDEQPPDSDNWLFRLLRGREQLKQEKKANKRDNKDRDKKSKSDKRDRKRAAWREWFASGGSAFSVTIFLIVVSVGSAAPFQWLYFFGKFREGGTSAALAAVFATALTGVVEGMTWQGAVYYFRCQGSSIAIVYRAETFVFAAVAATVNFTHVSAEYNVLLGGILAIASVMGVGAWEFHMLRTKQVRSGMSFDELKLWTSRRWHFNKEMKRARQIRATFGLGMGWEDCFRAAYVELNGQPTVPVPATDEVTTKLLQDHSHGLSGALVGTVVDSPSEADETQKDDLDSSALTVLDVPLDFRDADRFADIIRHAWPEAHAEAEEPNASAEASAPTSANAEASAETDAEAEATSTPLQGGSKPPSNAEAHAEDLGGVTSGNEQNRTAEPRKSERKQSRKSTRKPEALNAEASAEAESPRKTASTSAQRGSRSLQIKPTKAEVNAEAGSAGERIRKYAARVAKRSDVTDPATELDRSYVAQQFGVSVRSVRTALNEHKTASEK